jgi:hypothetical protein
LEVHLEEEHDDDDNFEDEQQERKPIDLVIPLKKFVKQIFWKTVMRLVLERLVVHYVSQQNGLLTCTHFKITDSTY